MKKKESHEDHIDETWLIPYSDMLTLLLALFIVMFAMSKVDTAKLQKASQEFNIILKQEVMCCKKVAVGRFSR